MEATGRKDVRRVPRARAPRKWLGWPAPERRFHATLWLTVLAAQLLPGVFATLYVMAPSEDLARDIDVIALLATLYARAPLAIGALVLLLRIVIRTVRDGDDPEKTSRTASAACACLVFLLGPTLFPGVYGLRFWGWDHAWRGVAERGEGVIEAIEAYHSDTGQYPDGLRKLVPDYLPAIPVTGVAGAPEFRYGPPGEDAPKGIPYGLWASDSAFVHSTCLMYWPGQGYPDTRDGFPVRRFGQWAYCQFGWED